MAGIGTPIQKAEVVLKTPAGDYPLAGTGAVSWRIQAGVQPYSTTFSAHNLAWEALKIHKGKPLKLSITDSKGDKVVVEDVYILHEMPSSSPSVTSFVVSDKRWKWSYQIIVRDYNLTRRTGDKNYQELDLPKDGLPDKFAFFPNSLKNGQTLWEPQDIIEDILETISKGTDSKKHVIEEFPDTGEITIQNVVLRDTADSALARALGYIPGADIYLDLKGKVRVFNTLNVGAAERHFDGLKEIGTSWNGGKVENITREHIRPSAVHVYYQRELEAVLEYSDDYTTGTAAQPSRDDAFIENVIATVDPASGVIAYDPEFGPSGGSVYKIVPPGTWVEAKAWLNYHNTPGVRPEVSAPWNFDTIRTWWVKGALEGQLIGSGQRGRKHFDTGNYIQAVGALRENFRQTFKISRRYMERLRDIRNVRVGIIDPITGQRQPASVWSQGAYIPTEKGGHIAMRSHPEFYHTVFNFTSLPQNGEQLTDSVPSPQRVSWVDKSAGIFRIESKQSTYGTFSAIIPGNCVDPQNNLTSLVRNLQDQDEKPVGAGMRLENGTNEFFLSRTYEFKVLLPVLPNSPNNNSQFHQEVVTFDDLLTAYPSLMQAGPKDRPGDPAGRGRGIKRGHGPVLEVFIPEGETSARFAWKDDIQAKATLKRVLGLDEEDPRLAGVDPEDPMAGYVFQNHETELRPHAIAVAAEAMSAYIDTIQGRVMTRVPPQGLELKGNMSGTTLQVSGAPSGRVEVSHDFPGIRRPISRLALMADSARKVILRILPFGGNEK